jgi:FlaA1/EpsC-like NDP-sugar epimerase
MAVENTEPNDYRFDYENEYRVVTGLASHPSFTQIESKHFFEKTFLVTGGAGSIGRGISETLCSLEKVNVHVLDRDEGALHSMMVQEDISSSKSAANYILHDLRDKFGTLELIRELKPDFIIHSAALKHLAPLEKFPRQAVLGNVIATRDLLDAATVCGVQNFLNISTDKAASPSSNLGRSKRITEVLTESYGRNFALNFKSVRFGNVYASKGSVIETFKAQIARGAPVTITHRNMKRMFMNSYDATSLVLQVLGLNSSGVYSLTLPDSIEIETIAKNLMRFMGKEVPIKYIGMSSGEKLDEILFNHQEVCEVTPFSHILRADVPSLSFSKYPSLEDDAGVYQSWLVDVCKTIESIE